MRNDGLVVLPVVVYEDLGNDMTAELPLKQI